MSKKHKKNNKSVNNNANNLTNNNLKRTIIPPYEQDLKNQRLKIQEDICKYEKERDKALKYLNSNHNIYRELQDDVIGIMNDFTELPMIKDKKNDIDIDCLLFDFENNVYYDGSKKYMPSCYMETGTSSLHIIKDNAIYIDQIVYSSAMMFLATKKELDKDIKHIDSFDKILNNTISRYNINGDFPLICMLPESIDLFNTRIRTCLKTSKGKIVSIPKSVAITYYLLNQLNIGDRYCVVNLDGLHPVLTQLSIGKDEKGNKIVFRERIIQNNTIKYNYINFAKSYLTLFENKYDVKFNDFDNLELIFNKKILKVLMEQQVVSIFRPTGRINVVYDEDIFKKCLRQYVTNDFNLPMCSKIFVISSIMGVINGPNIFCLSPEKAFDGLKLIRKKLLENPKAIIWKERLPKVSLEVIDEKIGRFKTINLIEQENEGQNIRLSGEEQVELPFRGTITLFKGQNGYYLPMKREVYATDINSDKEAYFQHKCFPLDRDIQVDLVVRYNYLDESPIKLYAIPKNKIDEFDELPNSWIDPHTIENYSGPVYEGNPKDIRLPIAQNFRTTRDNMRRFCNGDSRLSSNNFTTNKAGRWIHNDLMCLSKAHFFIRSTFDSDNVKKLLFKQFYVENLIGKWFEQAWDCLCIDEDDYGYNYTKYVNSYKEGLCLSLSEMIVAAWYYNKEDIYVNNIYDYLANMNDIETYIRLSRCIKSNKDDIFDVFENMTRLLYSYFSENNKNSKSYYKIRYIRALSQNCWFNKNWMKQFIKTSKGKDVIILIAKFINDYLHDGMFGEKKEYRDIMEFLVCLTLANNYDKNMFNPNNQITKELLNNVKTSYETVLTYSNVDLTSRLIINQDLGPLHGYKNYAYMLIMVLSGEGQVDLVGFKDE